MSAKKKYRTAADFLQYMKGAGSDRERYAFEREQETDPFEKDALEGLEHLTTEEAEADLLAMFGRLQRRLARRRRYTIYSIAATAASLLIVGSIFIRVHDFTPDTTEGGLTEEEVTEILQEKESAGPSAPVETMEDVPTPGVKPAESETIAEKIDKIETMKKGKSETEAAESKVTKKEIELAVADEKIDIEPEADFEYELVADPDLEAEEIVAVEAVPMESAAHAKSTDEPYPGAMDSEPAPEPVTPQPRRLKIESGRAKPEQKVSEIRIRGHSQKAAKTEGQEMILSGQVSGVVLSSEDMLPIPGAVVVVKGKNTGTVADINGQFFLPVSEQEGATLIASFIGMESHEYEVSEGADVELVLKPDLMNMDEVVMVSGPVRGTPSRVRSRETAFSPEEETGVDVIFAEPESGFRSFRKYIENNIRFPDDDSVRTRAVVVVKFNISPAGEILDIVPLRSAGQDYAEEVIRLLREGPVWKPATGPSGNFEDSVRMRIVFKK